MIIGICGGTASGKSTIIELLQEHFPGMISVIDMDNYYIPREDLSFEERRQLNYDVPESLDWDAMIRDIQSLKDGHCIEQPKYSFMKYERLQETTKTEPAPILIIDGIFSMHKEELRKLYDLKVFVDVTADVRLARRILRNMRLYGRPAEFEIEQYFEKVKPMHDRYVEPCKNYADMIIPFYDKNLENIHMLIKQMEKMTEN